VNQSNTIGGFLKILNELGKVRISIPVAFTTFTGYVLSRGAVDSGFILPFIGIFFLACGASALNQVQEAEIDFKMKRTSLRPIPSGRITKKGALAISMIYFVIGSVILIVGPGWLTFAVGLATMVWYNGIYTPLKRVSAFAVVPGSVVGALPPIAGWVAGGGMLSDPKAWVIAVFFFIGQIPHFWLLLLRLGEQYSSADMPTLTTIFSSQQIKRLTFVWIATTGVAALLLPYYSITTLAASAGAIISFSALLIVRFVPLLQTHKPFSVGKSFVLINLYYLIIMLILIFDKVFA